MPTDKPTVEKRKGKLAETIAETIKKDIIAMGWPVGKILGNEPQLQERYGVSRATIREAIRQLERHGVASMRRGKLGGLMIEQPAEISAVLALATYLELAHISIDELFEARNIIECMALEQAGARLPEYELQRAQTFIEALRDPEPLEFNAEMALHTQIRNFLRDTATNPATALTLDALYYITIHDLPPRATKKDVEQTLRDARRIRRQVLEALVGGDTDGAKHFQRELLAVGEWLVRKQLKGADSKASSGLVRLQVSPNNPVNEIFNKTAQRLALEIIQTVRKMRLKPGDHLGTEPELQERHNVSRAVLRESLRILELHCILVSKRGYGGGLVIAEPLPDYTVNIVVSYLQYYDFSTHYFFEVWKTLQLATSKMAAERITPEGKKRLETLLAREQSANPKEYLSAMRDLEIAISDLSGNRPMALFAQVLSHMAMNYPLGELPTDVIGPLSAAHEKSVRAIAAGEAGLARRAMSQYLEQLSAFYRPEVRDKWPASLKKSP